MTQTNKIGQDFTVAYYTGNRNTGELAAIQCRGGRVDVQRLTTLPESALAKPLKPILVGMAADGRVVLLDPKSKELRLQREFPSDAFPAHIYADVRSNRAWFMNDGDKETGNDTVNCGDQGSSVTVIENVDSAQARFLKTICIGRGHHQATFAWPSAQAPAVPERAYISNLNDGTISVIGNDPKDAATYLKLLATIDLCEPEREEGGKPATPNKSYPHGLAYSPLTGKLYNLNNGYGTLAVIDPIANSIEKRLPFKGYSNAFMVPGGRYLIGRGADRKSDAQHVIASMAVFDVTTLSIVRRVEMRDIYLSKYYFNPNATKIYFTTGSSGSLEQQANLKTDVLLAFDLTRLAELQMPKEIKVGSAGSVDFAGGDGRGDLVFASDGEGGAMVVIDGQSDAVLERIAIGAAASHTRLWTLAG